MRRIAQLLALATCLLAGPAFAVTAPPPDPSDVAAIRGVIEAQLKAFRADDGAQAFASASPAIQSIFKNPDTFMSMVRNTYQPCTGRVNSSSATSCPWRGGGPSASWWWARTGYRWWRSM